MAANAQAPDLRSRLESTSSSSSTSKPGPEVTPYGFADQIKSQNGRVFFQGETMIFSPNSKRSVHMPEYHPPSIDYSQKRKPDVTDFLEPQWFRGRDHAYLATLPRYSASQHGSFFEIFKDYNMPTVAIPDGDMFRLPSHVVDAWSDFEEAAQVTIGAIYSEANHRLAQITMIGSPSANGGYKSDHRSSEIVIRRAYASRLWFSLYIGALYWICMHGNTVKLIQNGTVLDYPASASAMPSAILSDGTTDAEIRSWLPLWFLCVLYRDSSLQPFLSMLRSVFSTCTWEASFTGMFIRIQDAHEIGGLSFCVRHNIPIWYRWGSAEEEYVREHPKLAYYRPPVDLMREAYAKKKEEQAEREKEWEGEGEGEGERDYELRTEEGGGGVPEMVDFAFYLNEANFRQRSPSLPPCVQLDSPPTPPSAGAVQAEGQTMHDFFQDRAVIDKIRSANQTSEQTELRWKLEQTQGTRNTAIFGWQLNSAQCWIRIRLPSRARALLDDEQSGYLKRYNPLRDELDFSPTFDPQPSGPIASGVSRTLEDNYIDSQIQRSYRTRLPELLGKERMEEDWAADDALDVVSLRYGFIPVLDEPPCSRLDANKLWVHVHQGLQLPGSFPNECPQTVLSYIRSLHEFIQSFAEAVTSGTADHGPRSAIWDAHRNNTILCQSIYVKTLLRLDVNHFLVGKSDECPWSLVTRNPVDAIHACRLRNRGFKILDIAWYFSDRGIPFLTALQSRDVRQLPLLDRLSIEVRTDGHVFTQKDYTGYLRLRRSILRRPGVALAAFKYGGIVWRITRDELGKLTEEELFRGPDLYAGGERLWELDGMVDIVLSDEEVAGICGVYHIATAPAGYDWANGSEPDTSGQEGHHPQGVHRLQSVSSSRYAPYPPSQHASVGPSPQVQGRQASSLPSAGLSAQLNAPLRMGSLIKGRLPKNHPLKRVSWFPTPDTLSAPRKGNMGHWTGKMELAYQKRLRELVKGDGVPKTATDWASLNFGTKAKHLMRASTAAATAVLDASAQSHS